MITLLHGDCCEMLETLPPRSVQCVVTSPPYFRLRDYGVLPTHWPEVRYTPIAGTPEVSIPEMECCLGLEDSPLAFVAHLVHVFRLCREVLRDDGVVWVNLGDSFAHPSKWGGGSGTKMDYNSKRGGYPRSKIEFDPGLKDKDLIGIPWRFALALQADGWYLRSDVIWEKSNSMPESVTDRVTRSHEYLFLLAKSPRYFYDAAAIFEPYAEGTSQRYEYDFSDSYAKGGVDARGYRGPVFGGNPPQLKAGRNKRSVWRVPNRSGRSDENHGHHATFPEALVELCVLAGSSSQVCPSCGAPWARLEEPTGHVNKRKDSHVPGAPTKTSSTGWAPTKVATDLRAPTCRCEDNDGSARSIVLDPFAGTGTTMRAAERLQRDSIGIELNSQYFAAAEKQTENIQSAMIQVLE